MRRFNRFHITHSLRICFDALKYIPVMAALPLKSDTVKIADVR